MKNGFVYVAIGVSMVIIGIFTMYYFNQNSMITNSQSLLTLYNPLPEKPAKVIPQTIDIYGKYIPTDIKTKFQSKIMSKEKAFQFEQDYIKKNNLLPSNYALNNEAEIMFSLNYVWNTPDDGPWQYSVDPTTGIPTYYTTRASIFTHNPQWWGELEKFYLGMESKRVENGSLVWTMIYGSPSYSVDDRSQAQFEVDAITGKVLLAYTGRVSHASTGP